MTLEEKIKHLQDASMEDARREGSAIVKAHSDALEQVFGDHKEASLRQAALRIKTETNSARLELNKAIAHSQIELKREQGNCQMQLKQKLFRRIHVLLKEYMQTPAYLEFLCSHIEEAVAFAKGEAMDIYLNPTDEAFKSELEIRTGVTLTLSREDFTGGLRSVLRERNILIDHSFSSALAEEYDQFLFTGGGLHG